MKRLFALKAHYKMIKLTKRHNGKNQTIKGWSHPEQLGEVRRVLDESIMACTKQGWSIDVINVDNCTLSRGDEIIVLEIVYI